MRVLIVDDEKNIRATLVVCLEQLGCEVGEIATAVEAVKRGAWDFVTKPFSPAQIRVLVGKVDERRTLVRRVAELEREIADAVPEVDLTTRSPAMRALLETATRVA